MFEISNVPGVSAYDADQNSVAKPSASVLEWVGTQKGFYARGTTALYCL